MGTKPLVAARQCVQEVRTKLRMGTVRCLVNKNHHSSRDFERGAKRRDLAIHTKEVQKCVVYLVSKDEKQKVR